MTQHIEKSCHYCQKILHGRADQRFCNDSCRNNFNRQLRIAEKIPLHPNAAEIIKIIKKNYEILKRGLPGQMQEDEGSSCATAEFLNSGFNINFYTSSFKDKDATEWQCIFDRCYSISGDTVIIQDFPAQAELD